jgi:hypothetical protein
MKPELKVVSSNAYRIEKNVPITTVLRGTIIYPFADMKRGDSFLVPATGEPELKRAGNSLHRQVRMFLGRFGQEYEFTTRRVDGGVRCWRVK